MDQRLKEHPDECEEGFLGSFYRGDRYVDKAIIFVGGSGETRRIVEARAAILAREGYSVLAVGYYLWKPLSKQTVAIPLDYVERAIYEKGSHLLGMPDEALDAMGDRDKLQRMLGSFLTMEKKYPKECAEARNESYQKILSFLRECMVGV